MSGPLVGSGGTEMNSNNRTSLSLTFKKLLTQRRGGQILFAQKIVGVLVKNSDANVEWSQSY